MQRTHHCAQLRKEQIGQKVTLAGWVHSRRDHGGIVFIDLRDREGVTQVLFDPEYNEETAEASHALRSEYVIAVQGLVRERPKGTVNNKLPTAEIEVVAHKLEILNPSETPPFPIEDGIDTSEELRLTYRYLDLRRPGMAAKLRTRHKVAKAVRDYFDSQGFYEIETPLLFKSTPEGAREYLVPSRVNPGRVFALPQSPQQFKQMLMVAGLERYFQIAKCFRDEDLRADRQPEFTQIDIEASFVEPNDIFTITEGMLAAIFKATRNIDIKTPFERLTYGEAVGRYGSDKPDRRFGMELVDLGGDF